jgi:hypothetical protein
MIIALIELDGRYFAGGYTVQQPQAALDVTLGLNGYGLLGKLRSKQTLQRFRRKTPEIA